VGARFFEVRVVADRSEAGAVESAICICRDLTERHEAEATRRRMQDDLQRALREHAEALAEYREFLDWYTRLNALLQGTAPPEPRLRLNEALARQEVIPLKIELTREGEKRLLRAEHDFTWLLSRDDEKRIDDVSNALFGYRQVSNEEFNREVRTKTTKGK